MLRDIATAHGVGASQVALAWMIQFHGDTVVVIPGATSVRQAEQNAATLKVTLTSDQLKRIDEASRAFL